MSTYNINQNSRLSAKLGYLLYTIAVFILLAISFYQLRGLVEFNVYNNTLPHILIASAFILVLIVNNLFSSLPFIGNKHDTRVLVVFALLCLNIYYSEMRGLSWQIVAYFFDAICLYYIARLFLCHHLKFFFLFITTFFFLSYIYPYAYSSESSSPFSVYGSTKSFMGLFFLYSLLSCVFIFWRRITAVHVFLFVMVFLFAFSLVFYRVFSPYFSYLFNTDSYSLVQQSVKSFETSLFIFKDFPLFGSGLGTYPFAYEAYRSGPPLSLAYVQSSLLVALADLGAIGLLTFLWMALLLLKSSFDVGHKIQHSGIRIWICVFSFAEVIWLCFFLLSPHTLHPITWLMFFTFHGVLASLVSDIEYSRKAIDGAPITSQLTSNYYLSFTNSVKLGLSISLILAGIVLSCTPSLTYRAIDKISSEKTTVDTVKEMVRINARFPFCAEAWDLYAKQLDYLQKYKLTNTKDALSRIKESLTHAKSLSPYTPAYYTRLAQTYNFEQKKPQVLETLSQGVANNPNDSTLRLLFARELALNGNNLGAIDAAKAALFGYYRGKADLHMIVSEYMIRNSATPAASRYLQYSLQHMPDPNINKDKLYNLGSQVGIPTIVLKHSL